MSFPLSPVRLICALDRFHGSSLVVPVAADVSELEIDRKKLSLNEEVGKGRFGPVLTGATHDKDCSRSIHMFLLIVFPSRHCHQHPVARPSHTCYCQDAQARLAHC